MKKIKNYLVVLSLLAAIMSLSIVASAAGTGCVTHISRDDIPSNWVFQYVSNVSAPSTHLYPSKLDSDNKPLEYSSCTVVTYYKVYGLKCRNCDTIVKYKTVAEPVHSVQH